MKGRNLLAVVILAIIPLAVLNAEVTVRLHQPPPGQLKMEHLWSAELNNTDQTTYTVCLYGWVLKEGKEVFHAYSNDFELPPGKMTIKAKDIKSVRDVWHASGYKAFTTRTGKIPEGAYVACIKVLRAGTREELGKNCIRVTVSHPGPPRLIAPKDRDTLTEKYPLFTWTPPMPKPAKLTYELRIVQILKGQTPEEAMLSKPAFYEKKGIKRPSFKYPPSARAFEEGKEYAWQVTAFSGRTLLGKSAIWWFQMAVPSTPGVLPGGEKEIYFADAGEVPGSVYRHKAGIDTKIYTKPSGRIYSFLFAPWDPDKLYFVNANEYKIFLKDLSPGAPPATIVHTHSTYVRDIAIPDDGLIYFSEATGAGGDGKIYRLESGGTVTLYYTVKLSSVDGFWGGDFAFDPNGTLYLSTGNRVGASIYKVDVGADVVTKIYTASGECIEGMTFSNDTLMYYADWRKKIYCLNLADNSRTIVYDKASRTWLSDIGLKPRETSVNPHGVHNWIMVWGVGGTMLDNIDDTTGLTSYGSVDSAPFGGYLGFRHGSSHAIPITTGPHLITHYRWLYKHDSIPGWNEFTLPVNVHYVKEIGGFLPTFPSYNLGPHVINSKRLYEFRPHDPPQPSSPGDTAYWPTSGFLGDIYSGFLSTAGEHLAPGRYQIKLEIYDSLGTQKMPGPATFRFIVPTGEDGGGTILTRDPLPNDTVGGAFVFALHIDNRPCSAYVAAPLIGSTAASDTCGFLRFDPADTSPVHIAYHASHPNGFARFHFKIVRGIFPVDSSSVLHPYVFRTSAGVYTGDGSGNYEHDFLRATLLGPCAEAALSENLYVYAKATRGWGQRISSYDASFVRAFALSEMEE